MNRELSVYQGKSLIDRVDHLAFGGNGFRDIRRQGSRLTPTGEYRVQNINPNSKFRLFFGLNYPTKAVADKALSEGVITPDEHQRIHRSISRTGHPPANTTLGGYIGIHGVGRGDPLVHEMFDWTQGCVAVTNSAIVDLSDHLQVGTRVVING